MQRNRLTHITLLFLLAAFTGSVSSANAQSGVDGYSEWRRADPPAWRDFSSIAFAEDGTGWLISSQDHVLYRTSQSQQWIRHEELQGDWKLIRDGDKFPLFLVGTGGQIRIYMDEQLEWMPIFNAGPEITITDVAALPIASLEGSKYGWTNFAFVAVGGRETDAGTEPYMVAFQPPARGWREVIVPSASEITAVAVRSPFSVKERAVIVAADTALYISHDEAFTFKPALIPANQEDKLLDVAFFDKDRGWAVGSDGALLWTRTGGNRWFKEARLTRNAFTQIKILGWSIFLIADNGQNRSELWTLAIQDDRPERVDLPFNDSPRDISLDWRNRRWLVGDRGMMYIQSKLSGDSEESWEPIRIFPDRFPLSD
jgi:hypothetical protein